MITITNKTTQQIKLVAHELKLGQFYVILNGEFEGKLIYTTINRELIVVNILASGLGLNHQWFSFDRHNSPPVLFAPVDIEINFEIQKNPN